MITPVDLRFVLVGPRSSGNVGASARALANLGFRSLRLVSPECDPLDPEAVRMAVDAADLLGASSVHDTLDGALDGAATVVGTSGREGKHRRPHYRLDEIAPELARLARAGPLAFVFGREDHGLSDSELDRCTHLVRFHAGADYPSFNLAQSVLLCAYTVRVALDGPVEAPALEPPAGHGEREAMYAHLSEALASIGFLHDETTEGMMRRIRRMLGRAALTSGEVKILRGIARQLLWAARRGTPEAEADEPSR